MTTTDPETTTYEIVTRDETFRFTVPSSFRVTYGPVAIGASTAKGSFGGGNSEGGMALRFYEDEKKQRAMFKGVTSFRDVSLPLSKKVESIFMEGESLIDSEGNAKSMNNREVDSHWKPVE